MQFVRELDKVVRGWGGGEKVESAGTCGNNSNNSKQSKKGGGQAVVYGGAHKNTPPSPQPPFNIHTYMGVGDGCPRSVIDEIGHRGTESTADLKTFR